METAMVPTVGRNVYFSPEPGQHSAGGEIVRLDAQPLLAFVVYVHSDELVNLVVLDHTGARHKLTSVPFAPPSVPFRGAHAYWMPYQIGQARTPRPEAPPPSIDRASFTGEQLRGAYTEVADHGNNPNSHLAVGGDANTGVGEPASDGGSTLSVESVGQPLSGAPVIEGRPA